MQGCIIKYSFTGASLSPDIKTISIQNFPNHANLIYPSLSQDLTESLKDKFNSQTRLDMIDENGDIQFEGEITDYSTKSVSIQGNETAALNRLTINVKVKYTNNIEPAQSFESSFSAFEDYDSSKSLDQVEGSIVPQILEKIIEDIFNKSVANW